MSEINDNDINVNKQNEISDTNNNINSQEENKKSEEKDCSDKKEEFTIDNEILKDSDGIKAEDEREIECQDKEEDLVLKNEVLENIDEINLLDEANEKINDSVLNLNDELNKYKYQIEEDVLSYEKKVLSYKEWALREKELLLKSKKTFDRINLIVEKFNEDISIKSEQLNDEDKKLVENRIKGINMINKMSKNAINNGISKLSERQVVDFNDIRIINDIDNKDKDEVRAILNENYSNITRVESQKSNLINSYLNFIEGNILSILDGVESGISFVENSTKDSIRNEVLPIYMELKMCLDELLLSINIRKIEVGVKTKIDFSYVEVLDIEDTEDESLDETIESVIRNGYEYLEDIYGVGHNHILRQAQIVACKYRK